MKEGSPLSSATYILSHAHPLLHTHTHTHIQLGCHTHFSYPLFIFFHSPPPPPPPSHILCPNTSLLPPPRTPCSLFLPHPHLFFPSISSSPLVFPPLSLHRTDDSCILQFDEEVVFEVTVTLENCSLAKAQR